MNPVLDIRFFPKTASTWDELMKIYELFFSVALSRQKTIDFYAIFSQSITQPQWLNFNNLLKLGDAPSRRNVGKLTCFTVSHTSAGRQFRKKMQGFIKFNCLFFDGCGGSATLLGGPLFFGNLTPFMRIQWLARGGEKSMRLLWTVHTTGFKWRRLLLRKLKYARNLAIIALMMIKTIILCAK